MARNDISVVFDPPLDVHGIHEITLVHWGEDKNLDEVFVQWGDDDGAWVRATRHERTSDGDRHARVWEVAEPVVADGKWTTLARLSTPEGSTQPSQTTEHRCTTMTVLSPGRAYEVVYHPFRYNGPGGCGDWSGTTELYPSEAAAREGIAHFEQVYCFCGYPESGFDREGTDPQARVPA